MCDFVSRTWNNPFDISFVNMTDNCLILKIEKSKFVTQYCTISLCNTIDKVVSKVILSRLKEHMNVLISPF